MVDLMASWMVGRMAHCMVGLYVLLDEWWAAVMYELLDAWMVGSMAGWCVGPVGGLWLVERLAG